MGALWVFGLIFIGTGCYVVCSDWGLDAVQGMFAMLAWIGIPAFLFDLVMKGKIDDEKRNVALVVIGAACALIAFGVYLWAGPLGASTGVARYAGCVVISWPCALVAAMMLDDYGIYQLSPKEVADRQARAKAENERMARQRAEENRRALLAQLEMKAAERQQELRDVEMFRIRRD